MTHQNEVPTNSMPSKEFINTEEMLLSLRKTKPWVRFISILGILLTISMAINALEFLIHGNVYGQSSCLKAFIAGFIFLLVIIVQFFPSYFLFQYSSAIGRLLDDGGLEEMEDVLLRQKIFWKNIGILMLIPFSFFAIIFILSIIFSDIISFKMTSFEFN
jgi:hypothetical protein